MLQMGKTVGYRPNADKIKHNGNKSDTHASATTI